MIYDFKSLIKNSDNIYAHKNNYTKETLVKHIYNTLEAFNYIDNEYLILNKLRKTFSNITFKKNDKSFKLSKDAINLIVIIFINAIGFHDIGKINPKFQVDKMSNDLESFIDKKEFSILKFFLKDNSKNTYHSPLSTLIYLDVFLKEINEKIPSSSEKTILIYILFCFGNTIKQHHGELLPPAEELNSNKIDEYISHINLSKDLYFYFYNHKFNLQSKYGRIFDKIKAYEFDTMAIFIWTKILYSTLVSCDFIATYSFYNNEKVSNFSLNNDIDLKALQAQLNQYSVSKHIEGYRADINYFKNNNLPLINELRSDIAIESKRNIKINNKKRMFMIESPTGSGKTFNSINCALEILNNKSKLIYAFPVNTLSTQTNSVLRDIFKDTIELQEINSITPLPITKDGNVNYQKLLLDKQLLNYQGILTSNVTLFSWLFSNKREQSMGLFSLFNSVIILDEIQNYKNSIWKETIEFLYKYSEIMNFKIILMSATLPNLDELIGFEKEDFTRLIKNPSIYYKSPLFKNRVIINNSLLNKKVDYNFLIRHLIKEVDNRNVLEGSVSKVIIEFITKKSCKEFYELALLGLKEFEIYHLDGDTNSFSKEGIIKDLKKKTFSKNVLLCTTQVVEAGVDIDMDIGYKDAVFPDVDEQFLGRINRSASKENCIAYFFNLDNEVHIYKDDYRLFSNISNPKYFKCITDKNFKPLYEDYVFKKIDKLKLKPVLSIYKEFIDIDLKLQKFNEIYKKMQLINNQTFNIFIPSIVNGINGKDVWDKYINILSETNYAKRRIKLINLRKEMSYFIYSIYGIGLEEELPIGGLYYIDDGVNYLSNNTFNSLAFKDNYIIKK